MNSKRNSKTAFALAIVCAAVCAFGGNGNAKTDSANAIADSVNAISANVNAAKLPTISDLKARMDEDAEIIALLKSLYEREVETTTGRQKWHGALKNQIVNTNDLVKVSVYADGKEFKDAWKLEKPKDMVAQAARKLTATTNGIPAKLAAARAKRVAAINEGVAEVSVTVEVGKDKQKSNNGNGKGAE